MLQNPSYRLSFLLAAILHLAIGIVLCLKIAVHSQSSPLETPANIIKAFSVSQSDIEKITQNIAAAKQQELLAEEQKQKALQQEKLETALKQQMAKEQMREAEKLKEELKAKNQAVIVAQKAKEKNAMQEMLQNELSKEANQLHVKEQKLKKMPQAATAPSVKKVAQQVGKKEQPTQTANTNTNNTESQSQIDKYKAMIVAAIATEWIVPDGVDENDSCKLLIKIGPGGVVLNVQIIQPSNNSLLNRSAQNAVWKASPLPVPKEGETFDKFRQIQLTVRPQGIISS